MDFEIELTATGPMHDGRIEIIMPDVFDRLQEEESDEPNHVRVSASVRDVTFEIEGVDDRVIISTGDLDADEGITVRIEDVDIPDDVEGSTQFEVGTKTRGTEADLEDVTSYREIVAANITGGVIRRIEGSGTMAVKPINVEQGSHNVEVELTFTAQADFSNLDLEITVPAVIDTELQKDNRSGDGYVSGSGGDFHADHKDKDAGKADDELVVGGSTITWNGLILDEGQTFTTTIKDVDLLDQTGDFRWDVSLGGEPIMDDDNPAMVVLGTTEDDVVFEIIEDGSPIFEPYYPAASEQEKIQFRFTTENTTIQEGGELRFRLPRAWSAPGVVGEEGDKEATVAIVTENEAGDPLLVKMIPPKDEDNEGEEMTLLVSRRDVVITIGEKGELNDESDPIIIQYGTKEHPVKISARAEGTDGNREDGLAIRGHFKVNNLPRFRQRDAGTIFVDVTNVMDGSGDAMFDPTPRTVRAGSDSNLITVVFTAVGTMDGGAVRFTIPDGWGEMQDEDPLELNYIEVDVSGTDAELDGDPEITDDGLSVGANLETFGEGDKVTFTYGGGSAGSESNGAVAQADISNATFMIESYGGDSGDNDDFRDIREVGDDDEADTEDPLTIVVKGAAGGSGDGTAEIKSTSAGEGLYDGVTDMEEGMLQVHAGDDSTYIVFTYTATQTIAEGKLRFTVPPGWSAPQDESTGKAGYTYLDDVGGAVISNEDYEAVPYSVEADITLNLGDSIEIHYGAENGGAEAPDAVPSGGYSQFVIAIQGTLDDDAGFNDIPDEDGNLDVKVRVQRSGGGMAEVDPMNVNAGDAMSTITVTYTADGQIDDGQLRLTIPGTAEDWDAPMIKQRYGHRRRLRCYAEVWRCLYGSRPYCACRSCC